MDCKKKALHPVQLKPCETLRQKKVLPSTKSNPAKPCAELCKPCVKKALHPLQLQPCVKKRAPPSTTQTLYAWLLL
jgi:hypothetical protein